ncbi:hypothetical protein BC939DRAFT_465594, partial [Gamsiella multidivaricata]|uniref:uncharacterized protein n=1 Tax=Gamsiella multidivaricata TaxID=101098 RepID=UPI002220AC1B
MVSISIRLKDPYLVLPIDGSQPMPYPLSNVSNTTGSPSLSPSYLTPPPSATPSQSSSATESLYPSADSPNHCAGATLLKGTLILTLSRPIRVASLVLTLSGSSHLALSTVPGSDRSIHYSQQHFRAKQFLIKPSPQPEHFTTIVAPSVSSVPILVNSASLNANQIEYPFAIPVPNTVPVSVVTPQGGTTYQLSAELTTAKSKGTSSGIKALLTAATGVGSSSVLTATTAVQIYRAGRLPDPPSTTLISEQEGNDSTDQDEDAIIPDSISHTWPGHLEATVSVPYVHLPPKSMPDLKVAIKLLRTEDIAIKIFQVELYERAIFRLTKSTGATTSNQGTQSRAAVVGIRDRVVSTQRMDKGWPTASSRNPGLIEQSFQFKTPSAVRGPNELYSSRNCNASTYYGISKQERQRLKEDGDKSKVRAGTIDIEIQHFLRFSVFLTGLTPGPGATGGAVERQLGDIPVVVGGVPRAAQCDDTDLPSYMESFSTSLVSLEQAQTYEVETGVCFTIDSEGDGDPATGYGVRLEGDSWRNSRLSSLSSAGSASLHGDFENDDAFMPSIGLRRSRTPPRYEDSTDQSSLDESINDLESNSSIMRGHGQSTDTHYSSPI